jgi:hypothetical protein
LSGRVTSDSTREGISGVSVTIKGTRTSTATASDGRYSLSVPHSGNPVLVFSSIGYTANEVLVGSKSVLDVTLNTSSRSALTDIVVVGYQTVRRRDLTGSVSSVGAYRKIYGRIFEKSFFSGKVSRHHH